MEIKINVNKVLWKERVKVAGGLAEVAIKSGISVHTLLKIGGGYSPSKPLRILLSIKLGVEELELFQQTDGDTQ